MVAAVLLYLDRICISFAERFIKQDLLLSDREVSWVLSAFFWTYGLGQVPSGWLGDRFGARIMLVAYILTWSLFTGLTGVAVGFGSLLVFRFGFGFGQAGAFPTSAGLLSRWVPLAARGRASSIVAFGGRVGGAIAPLATAYLLVLFVPVGVSSLLDPADLLDPPRLCFELARPDGGRPESAGTATPSASTGLSARILASLPDDVRRAAHELAEDYAGSVETLHEPGRQLAPHLTAGLNELIRRRDFYRAEDFRHVLLPREAKRLLARPREELSDLQVQRLNRLLLEAAYPESIRKVYVHGWRRVMWVYGCAGLAVAGLFWFVARDRPSEHARCNAAERALVGTVGPVGADTARTTPAGAKSRDPFPWKWILLSRSLWLSSISQFGTNFGWLFLISWLPRYLSEVHRVPVELRGELASVPLFVGWFGMLGGGWLTDWLTRRVGLRWGRRLPMALTRFVAMAAFLVCLLPVSHWTATAALAVVALATDLGTASVWAFKQDVGGRHVGSILGWGNMWGNLGAALSPVVLNWIIGQQQNWDAAFVACAAAFLLSGVAAMGVDATVPVVPQGDNSRN
jgi:nitrate/nitrite transporter NarK